jgi:hypothetical protein
VSQPLVLAIEPDLRQAAIVKRIVREKALADVVVVDSLDAAVETMRTAMPDVLLLSALLSPRDEDELVTHLKTLDHAGHLQTHTIPQLASSLNGGEERASKGLLSAFRRKKESTTVAGCDPDMFADEIRAYLERAAEKKYQLQQNPVAAASRISSPSVQSQASAAEAEEAPAGAPDSAWSSPFEWKPAGAPAKRSSRGREDAPAHKAAPVAPPEPEPIVAAPEPEPIVAAPIVEAPLVRPAEPEPIVVAPAAAAPIVESPVVEPSIAAPVAEAPIVLAPPAPEPVVAKAAPVLEIVTETPEPAPVASKTPSKPVEAPRPKPVADRAPKVPLRELLAKPQFHTDGGRPDRLGPLARWARTDMPRAAKGAVVTSDDVRALISSLAVPSAVASVTYPSGVRIRRVRVPILPDHEAARQASA